MSTTNRKHYKGELVTQVYLPLNQRLLLAGARGRLGGAPPRSWRQPWTVEL